MFFKPKQYKSKNPFNKQGLYLINLLKTNSLNNKIKNKNTTNDFSIGSDEFSLVLKKKVNLLVDNNYPNHDSIKNACIYLN